MPVDPATSSVLRTSMAAPHARSTARQVGQPRPYRGSLAVRPHLRRQADARHGVSPSSPVCVAAAGRSRTGPSGRAGHGVIPVASHGSGAAVRIPTASSARSRGEDDQSGESQAEDDQARADPPEQAHRGGVDGGQPAGAAPVDGAGGRAPAPR